MYSIEFSKSAHKDIKSLPKPYFKNVMEHVDALRDNPYSGAEKIKGASNMYRIRVGKYRILYEVYNQILLITVVRIAHRKEVYRGI